MKQKIITRNASAAPRVLPEIEKYNYVGPKNFDFPHYDATKAERKIELYFNSLDEVIIAAWAGDSYVFWLSVTKVEDVERNRQIFHHIAYEELEYVNRFSKALAAVQLDCSSLVGYYRVELRQVPELKRNKEILRSWVTPFGHLYEKERAEENGNIFAEDVRGFGDSLRARCKLREVNGSYEAVLRNYAAELKKAEVYDDRIRILEEILRGES